MPYKGAAPALADLLGGRVHATFDGLASLGPHVASRALRVLAVQMPRRSPLLPDTPKMAEAGFGKMQAIAWGGIMAPAGTPKAIIDRLNAAVVDAVADPTVQARLRDMGGEPASSTPEELGKRVRNEAERWPKIARDLGIKAE